MSTSSLRAIRTPSTRSLPTSSTGEARNRSAIRRPLAGALRVLGDDLDVLSLGDGRRLRLQVRARGGVELGLRRIDDDGGDLAQLAQLRRRVRRLRRSAPAEHDDLLDRRRRERRERVVGDVGRAQLVGAEHQQPRDVERDVAVADHDRPLRAEVEAAVGVVGVAVVPGDELGRRVRAGQLLARDPHPPVGRRADPRRSRRDRRRPAPRAAGRGRSRRCRGSGIRAAARSARTGA